MPASCQRRSSPSDSRPFPQVAWILAGVLLVTGISCESSRKDGLDYLNFVEELPQVRLPRPSRLSSDTRAALSDAGLLSLYHRDPLAAVEQFASLAPDDGDIAHQVSLAEMISARADRVLKTEPRVAIGWYTEVARLTLPMSLGSAELPEENHARHLYNRSVARLTRAIDLEGMHSAPFLRVDGPLNEFELALPEEGDNHYGFDFFDEFRIPDELTRQRTAAELEGTERKFGGAIVGFRRFSQERDAEAPMMPEFGTTLPLATTLDFPDSSQPNKAQLVIHDLLIENETTLQSQVVPLVEDYDSALRLLRDLSPIARGFGIRAMFDPDRFLSTTGLLRTEPFREDKIPVIFVHGLSKSPAVWGQAIRTLWNDPVIRDRYQLISFRYPSGYAAPYAGHLLREELRRFQEAYDPDRRLPAMRRMVIVGKSFGGIVASMQVRDSGNRYLDLFFQLPLEDTQIPPNLQDQARAELVFQANPDIERVVFMVTPHLGTDVADKRIVDRLRRLIKDSLDVVIEDREQLLESGILTDYGQFFVTDSPSSVENLKSNSPVLTTLAEMPFSSELKKHSIIGKRGNGPLEESNDKMVPYWSSHLESADSEAVIPTIHGQITYDPDAIAEIRRILLEHLE